MEMEDEPFYSDEDGDEDYLTYHKIMEVGTDVIINQTKNYLQTRIIYYVMKLHIRPRSIWLSRVSSLHHSHFSGNTH